MWITQKDSHHPEAILVNAVGKVIKCQYRTTKAGQTYWTGFIDFDYEYKREQKVKERALNVAAWGDMAKKMIIWKNGEILAIEGRMTKSVSNGKEYYNINACWIHDQHNYSVAANASVGDDEDSDDDMIYDDSTYDPGF